MDVPWRQALSLTAAVPALVVACGGVNVYKSAFDLSDMSDAMNFGTAGSIVPRHVSDLKPCVYDAPLRGSGA